LRKWQEIEDMIDDMECALRFEKVYKVTRNEEKISFDEVKKKYNFKLIMFIVCLNF